MNIQLSCLMLMDAANGRPTTFFLAFSFHTLGCSTAVYFHSEESIKDEAQEQYSSDDVGIWQIQVDRYVDGREYVGPCRISSFY